MTAVTVTPSANNVPKADASGKIAAGWIDSATTKAALGLATTTVDNALIRADGVTGGTQNSLGILSDTGDLTGIVALTASGVVTASGTTEASAIGTANSVNAGGASVAKRSLLGTIGSSFKGNVLAGVQDATAAVTGQVGEVLSSVVASVAAASSTTTGNVTSLSITAGDWLISGFAVFAGGATGFTSGSTIKLSIVTTTATNGTSGATMVQSSVLALLANDLFTLSIPMLRINIAATTTYYLTATVTFAAGSPTVDATLIATRIR